MIKRTVSLLTLGLLFASPSEGQNRAPEKFLTPIEKESFDLNGFSVWVNGEEVAIEQLENPRRADLPDWVVARQGTTIGHGGRAFGTGSEDGPRHLRVSLTSEVPIGTILTRGNVKVSVLKNGETVDLADETKWITGERIGKEGVTSDEVRRKESYTVWVFPPNTTSRVLRFTHEPDSVDPKFEGWLGGAHVLSSRYANLAPQAVAVTKSNQIGAPLVNNEADDSFNGWGTIKEEAERTRLVSEEGEWVILTWDEPITTSGGAFIFPGFVKAEVDVFVGDSKVPPRDAGEESWKTMAKLEDVRNFYPLTLELNWYAFEKEVTTRAIRLRITEGEDGVKGHPHVLKLSMKGKRAWLGEWMVFKSLGGASLATAAPKREAKPGGDLARAIPVKFTLPEEGWVTLVVEDSEGKRVRNLVSNTYFPKGENTVWWDTTDDLGRDFDAPNHGLYKLPVQFVKPGKYSVRGLWHKKVTPFYEMSVYNPGTPPWRTENGEGDWLANHSAPQAAAFVPGDRSPTGEPVVYVGCWVTEGADGLAWLDLTGRKRGGKRWIGGHWTAAPFLAHDAGKGADASIFTYAASTFPVEKKDEKGRIDKKALPAQEIRITGLTADKDREIYKELVEPPAGATQFSLDMGGIAARDGMLVVSLGAVNELLIIDGIAGGLKTRISYPNPKGLAFDAAGDLLVLSGKELHKITAAQLKNPGEALKGSVVIKSGLEDPVGVTVDADGKIFISDQGESHQVKVFSPKGKFLSAIGKPGKPRIGKYDPLSMNKPSGLAIDSQGQLWVTENHYFPRRVSAWTKDGKLLKSLCGPSKYGGGGRLDPQDRTVFYYAEEQKGSMAFKLDWETGSYEVDRVLYLKDPSIKEFASFSAPETPIYYKGRRFFTDSYNSHPVIGGEVGSLFEERDGVLHRVAAAGRANALADFFSAEEFKELLPKESDLKGALHSYNGRNVVFFLWVDKNGDERMQPAEVQFRQGRNQGVVFQDDLSLSVAFLEGETVRFRPLWEEGKTAPSYDLNQPEVVFSKTLPTASSGGSQALISEGGDAVVTLGTGGHTALSITGGRNGETTWSYPNLWPGLHASHRAPTATDPGQVLGVTRLLSGFFSPQGSEVKPLWAVNGNFGNFYIFTADGLFVTTIFKDNREGKGWRMPKKIRGVSLEDLSMYDENFWPTIGTSSDGKVYAVDGRRSAVVRIEGLESLRAISPIPVEVTQKNIDFAQAEKGRLEEARREVQGEGLLRVAFTEAPLAIDGNVQAGWEKASWVSIDEAGTAAYFNANTKPFNIRGSLQVGDGKLYAAWTTKLPRLLDNSGDQPNALFTTGGALDLMLSTDPQARPDRKQPVAGDLRLVIAKVPSAPRRPPVMRALLYRAVVPGTAEGDKVPFSSPSRTITIDKVEDVTAKIQFAEDGKGDYEVAIPLDLLGLIPELGKTLRGDIGVIRGDGSRPMARTYWSNKAAGITSDVPSEATLSPHLWGTLEFVKP